MPIDGEVNQTCHPERGKKEGEEGGGGKQNIGGKRERERERERQTERQRVVDVAIDLQQAIRLRRWVALNGQKPRRHRLRLPSWSQEGNNTRSCLLSHRVNHRHCHFFSFSFLSYLDIHFHSSWYCPRQIGNKKKKRNQQQTEPRRGTRRETENKQ